MDLKSQVLSGLKWIALMRLCAQAFSWISTILVMRLLAPADYGLLAMASVFVSVLLILAEGGIGLAAVQAVKIGQHQLRQVFGMVLLVNGALFLALCLVAPLISTFFEEPRLTSVVRALAVPFLISAFAAVPDALLTREMRFRAQSVVEFCSSLMGAVTTLTAAMAGLGVWSLVAGSLISAVSRTLGVNIAAPFLRMPVFSVSGAGALVRFGGHAVLGKILGFMYAQADTFIGGKVLGKDLLGLYTVGRELASLPNAKIAGMINTISFSAFSRIQGDSERFANSLQRTARALFLIVLPVGWGMSSVAEELIPVFLGAKWEGTMLPFKILGIAMPLRLLATYINSANLGQGRADLVTWCVLAPAAVMIPGFLVGVQWGVVGLATSWSAGFILSFLIILRIALPSVGVRSLAFLRELAPVAGCGALMYGTVSIVRWVLPDGIEPAFALGVLVTTGALVFVGAIFAVARTQALDALSLVRR